MYDNKTEHNRAYQKFSLSSERFEPIYLFTRMLSLQWRHDEHGGVSNKQSHDCSLGRLFRRRSKKTSKLRVTGLCDGKSPVDGEFPAQRASNGENVSIWWRHHVLGQFSQALTLPYHVVPNLSKFSWISNNDPGGRLNKKDGLTRYGDSHVKDKTS